MLDECKGEKFEEILVFFSSMVLKKEVVKRGRRANKGKGDGQAIARHLGTALGLKEEERKSLLPLTIAHRASLQKSLVKKQVQRQRFGQFLNQLDEKEEDIKERNAKAKIALKQCPLVKHVDVEKTEKMLREHWLGDTAWVDVLLYGDAARSSDHMLSQNFDKDIWPEVRTGQSLKVPQAKKGFLESLDERVQEQQQRLREWRKFRGLKAQEVEPPKTQLLEMEPSDTHAGAVPKLDRHEHLQLGKLRPESPSKLQISHPPDLRSIPPARYRKLLLNLQEDLNRASKMSPRTASRSKPQDFRPALEPSIERKTSFTQSKVLEVAGNHSVLFSEPEVDAGAQDPSSLHNSHTPSELPETLISPAIESLGAPLAESPPDSPLPPSSPPRRFPISTSRTDDRLLSLAERTRKSIAVATGGSEDSLLIPSSPPTMPAPSPSADLPTASPSKTPNLDRRASLLDRTRLSMAGAGGTSISASTRPRKAAAGHSHHRRPSRQSHFPVNQFEASQKTRKGYSYSFDEEDGNDEEVGGGADADADTTPKQDLFSDDAEYASVFKSRPRVALSPALSPRHDEDEGIGERRVVSPLGTLGDV